MTSKDPELPKQYWFLRFSTAAQTLRVNCNKMAGDKLKQFVNRNCYRLSRISWALAQISCSKPCQQSTSHCWVSRDITMTNVTKMTKGSWCDVIYKSRRTPLMTIRWHCQRACVTASCLKRPSQETSMHWVHSRVTCFHLTNTLHNLIIHQTLIFYSMLNIKWKSAKIQRTLQGTTNKTYTAMQYQLLSVILILINVTSTSWHWDELGSQFF